MGGREPWISLGRPGELGQAPQRTDRVLWADVETEARGEGTCPRPGREFVSEVQDQTIITQRGERESGVCVCEREKEANELDSLRTGIEVM